MHEHIDTLIIGAGPAGLATSAALAGHGVEHLVLERGRVGESWRTQRWDGFRLNSPEWMNRLPGAAACPRPSGGFARADELIGDLERYVADLRLPVREGAAVSEVRREGDGYQVVAGGHTLFARNVVLASGAQNVASVPAVADELSPRVEQVHSSAYRRPSALRPGGVLVVGSGQSGGQIAEELLAAGRRVYLATSHVGRLPRFHRGRDFFAWARDAGILDTPTEAVDPAMRGGGQPLLSGTRGRRTLSLQHLARAGAVLLGRVADADGERVRLAGDLRENVEHGDRTAAAMRQAVDDYIDRMEIDAPVHRPDPEERPLTVRDRASLHLGGEGISTVVWATGLRGDFSWLRMPVLDERGRPHQEHGALPAPGMFVVGQPWQSRRTSAGMWGIGRDAPAVAAQIAARGEQQRLAA